jgi:hypothetical protein
LFGFHVCQILPENTLGLTKTGNVVVHGLRKGVARLNKPTLSNGAFNALFHISHLLSNLPPFYLWRCVVTCEGVEMPLPYQTNHPNFHAQRQYLEPHLS